MELSWKPKQDDALHVGSTVPEKVMKNAYSVQSVESFFKYHERDFPVQKDFPV